VKSALTVKKALVAIALVVLACAAAPADNTDAVFERLKLTNLEAVRQDLNNFRKTLAAPAATDGYKDLRAVIHSHSLLSHDSRGTLDQMVEGAKASGTDVVMLTDHPSPQHNVITEGFSGMHDGVLFFPGAETRNNLIYSPVAIDPAAPPTEQALIDLVNAKGGTIFLSHVEEIKDFGLTGLTGMEIHNIHYGLIDAPGIAQAAAAQNQQQTARLLTLIQGIRLYPTEAFAALAFRQDVYLRPFDALSQKCRLTAVAANDSHANTGIVLKMTEGNKVVMEDILGEQIKVMEASQVPFPGLVRKDAKPGDVLFKLQFDPYAVSMGHVGTYVLAKQLSADDFLAGLRAGHAYIGFDWIASAKGFRFAALDDGKPVGLMGDEIKLTPGLSLVATLPGSALVRLYRNGEAAGEIIGREAKWPVSQPGVYRVEAYVTLGGEARPWIFSNPIYVR
jgi:hypothetical protein